MGKFQSFHFHAMEQGRQELAPRDFAPAPTDFGMVEAAIEPEIEEAMGAKTFHNDESAARHYMNALWVPQNEGTLFGITAPESPELVPDLRLISTQESPATETRLLHFDQRANNLPVLGAKAVVELSRERGLVSVDAQIADTPELSPIATITAADALRSVAGKAGVEVAQLGALPAPALMYYRDETWHLVYEVRNVPVAPPDLFDDMQSEEGHGLGPSPLRQLVALTYLVDANDGEVLLYYSESAWLDLPTSCQGLDEFNAAQTFFGQQTSAGVFEMRDPLRNIRTFDFSFGHILNSPPPSVAITHTSFDFAGLNKAAVSAHVNATRVYDFFNDVLKRDGVDDKNMELVSIVNCTYEPPGKDWKNAVWHQKRMWYGQVQNAGGTFDSYSRYLDIIAHELTHGVTETTAGLKYLNQSGALSESFSDIFGIIVKNLNGPTADEVSKWDWELGTGLGKNGLPLRDLSDPKRTGKPDHMDDYVQTTRDAGGVHTNSSIHNKAAFHVLTAQDAQGNLVFPPKQAALLYYLALTRLTIFASFMDVLSTLQNVIRTLLAGRPEEAQVKIDAVLAAYEKVGIRLPSE